MIETIRVESIPIIVGRENDGRWWADIESMPGVMAYGATRELVIAAVPALALRVAADCIDHGEEIPASFTKVLSVAEPVEVDQGEATAERLDTDRSRSWSFYLSY